MRRVACSSAFLTSSGSYRSMAQRAPSTVKHSRRITTALLRSLGSTQHLLALPPRKQGGMWACL